MSDTRAPKEYLLGGTIVLRVLWTHPDTGAVMDNLSPEQMQCWIRHEDDPAMTMLPSVRAGGGMGLFEADHDPNRTGVWHYAFVYLGPPRAIEDGDYEVVQSDVGPF